MCFHLKPGGENFFLKMSDSAVEAAPGVAASEPVKPKPTKAPPLDPRLKQIKIKTGVLKRVGKEKLSYRKEADMQKAKLDKMKEDGRGVARDTDDDTRLSPKNRCSQGGIRAAAGD